MSSIAIPVRRHYGLLLANFQKKDGECILSRVHDFNPADVPENSIGVLEINNYQCTAWVIAVPAQLTIGYKQVLCFLITHG